MAVTKDCIRGLAWLQQLRGEQLYLCLHLNQCPELKTMSRNDPRSQRPRPPARIKFSRAHAPHFKKWSWVSMALSQKLCVQFFLQCQLLLLFLPNFRTLVSADFYWLFCDIWKGWNQCASKNYSKNYVNNRGAFPTYTQNALLLPQHTIPWEGCNFVLKPTK